MVTPIQDFTVAEIREIVGKRDRGIITISDLKLLFLELQGYDLDRVAQGLESVFSGDAAIWEGRYLTGIATVSDLKEVLANFLPREELELLFDDLMSGPAIVSDLSIKLEVLGNDYDIGSGSGSGSASASGSASGSGSASASGSAGGSASGSGSST